VSAGATHDFASCIYTGRVMHRRARPRRHKLAYEVASFLVDLDELPTLDRRLRGFSYNRFGLFGFHDRDHGPGTGEPLKPWVEQHLAKAGIVLNGGPVRLLCYPRLLGYVFNPLSVYFCYRADGNKHQLAAILYEVTNTFRERHSYLIPADENAGMDGLIRQACAKELYVSPFIDMDMTYNFRIKPPAEDLAVAIHATDKDGPLLFASFNGQRQAMTAATLRKSFYKFPFLTVKVIAGIHWEALKLWLKGVPLVHHPRPPAEPVTVIQRQKKIAA